MLDQLFEYGQSDIYPFHMPGHKRRLSPEHLTDVYGMDITEIEGFDNLHDPHGVILEAEKYAAQLFHSEETAYLTGGSTCGILSAIAGICPDGSDIMVARNSHKSVFHAVELHHLRPVYVYPHVNTKYGINEGIYPQDVENMWINHPDVKAVVITSPTYDGVVSDIKEICRIAHSHNVPVIVDEAHGAHFNFSSYFPESAVACGADIVIQSTHKTLPALTQTALMHMNGTLADRERIRRMLTIYQSSSPSYILMASIDSCLHMMKDSGDELFGRYTKELENLRRTLGVCRNIHLVSRKDLDAKYTYDLDRSKLVLSVRGTKFTGKKLYDLLLHEYGLQMEMTGADYVLGMTSAGDTPDGYERLIAALKEIDETIAAAEGRAGVREENRTDTVSENREEGRTDAGTDTETEEKERYPKAVQKMPVYDAVNSIKESVYLKDAGGMTAADYIYVYPPGTPVAVPGEIFTDEVIGVIRGWLNAGLDVSGVSVNGNAASVRVVKGP